MTRKERLVLAIAVVASIVVFLDGSVINVALPKMSQDLGGGLSTQQWIVNAYLITLGSLILLAGSLSDLAQRQRPSVRGQPGRVRHFSLAPSSVGSLLTFSTGVSSSRSTFFRLQ